MGDTKGIGRSFVRSTQEAVSGTKDADPAAPAPAAPPVEQIELVPVEAAPAKLTQPVDAPSPLLASPALAHAAKARVLSTDSKTMGIVGEETISEADVRAVADTFERNADLVAVVQTFAARFEIVPAADEDEAAFFERLCDELALSDAKPPPLAELDAQLDEVIEKSEISALLDLIDNAVMRRGIPDLDLSTFVDLSISEQNGLMRSQLVTQLGSEAAADTFLANGVEAAVWAPHDAALAPVVSGQDALSVKRVLADMYGGSLASPALVAKDLARKDSPASEVARLIKTSGATSWTYASLVDAANKDASLLPLVQRAKKTLGVDDPFVFGPTPIKLTAGHHALVCATPRVEQPVFKHIKQNALRFAWVTEDKTMSLALAAPLGSKPRTFAANEVGEAQNVLLAAIEARLPDARRFFDVNGPSFEQCLNGLAPYADAALICGHPAIAQALVVSLMRALQRGDQSGDTLRATMKKAAQLPEPPRQRLLDLCARVPALASVQPLPLAVSRALRGGETLVINNDDAGNDCLRGLSVWFQVAGVLPPGAEPLSSMRSLLASLANKEGTITLSAEVLAEVLASTVMTVDATPRYVGDLLAAHPVIAAHRSQGGKSDVLSLVTEYMRAQGFDVTPGVPFINALIASSKVAISAEALKRAEAALVGATRPSKAALREMLGTSYTIIFTKPPRVALLDACTDAQWSALMARLRALAEPAAERTYSRSELGLLAQNEPIVALKLFAMSQYGGKLSSSRVEGTLTPLELATLRDFVCLPVLDASNPLFAAFSAVQAKIESGKLVLASIDAGRSSDHDLIVVLDALKQMAEVLRKNSVQTTRASAALDADAESSASLSSFPDPLRRAGAILRTQPSAAVTLGAADLALLETRVSTDVSALDESVQIKHRRFCALFSQEDAALVREGFARGTLVIDEAGVRATERGSATEAAGQRVLDAFIAAADVEQAKKAVASDGTVGHARRLVISAAHHLGTAVGFQDSEAQPQAETWLTVALKLERLKEVTETDPAKRQLSLMSVTADDIDYVLAHYRDVLGRSAADTATSGAPDDMPKMASAITLLEKMSARMREGYMAPWPSLDALLSDIDPEVRMAKKVIGRALMRRYIDGASTSAGAAALATARSFVALAPQIQAVKLKAMLAFSGSITSTDVTSAALSPQELRAAANVCRERAAAGDEGAARRALVRAAERLDAAAEKGPLSVSSLRPSEALTNAVAIAADAVSPPLPRAAAGVFDVSRLLPATDELIVRSPMTNVVPTGPASDNVVYDLGRTQPLDEQLKGRLSAWVKTVRFDPTRAMETTIGTHLMFRYLVPSQIAYDLSVAPLKRTADAAERWWNAGDEQESRAAIADLWRAWSMAADTFAIVTDFLIPVGFTQELVHDVQEGNLDVAAGKSVVLGPMIYHGFRHVAGIARSVHTRIALAGKPYHLVDVSFARVTSTPVTNVRVSTPTRVAQRVYSGGLALADVVKDPKATVWAPVRFAREKVARVLSTRPVLGFASDGSVSFKLTALEKSWLRSEITQGAVGQITFTLEQSGSGGAVKRTPVTLTTRELKALVFPGNVGKPVSTKILDRMGLSGKQQTALVAELHAALPPDMWKLGKIVDGEPSLLKLASNPGDTREWTVSIGGKVPHGPAFYNITSKPISIKNSTLLKLVRQHFGGNPEGFAATVKQAGLSNAHGLLELVTTLGQRSLSDITAADRRALIGDLGSRLGLAHKDMTTRLSDLSTRVFGASPATTRLALADAAVDAEQFQLQSLARTFATAFGQPLKNGRVLLSTTTKEGLAVRVIQDKRGGFRIRSGRHDITDSAVGRALSTSFERIKTDFGTANLQEANELRLLVETSKTFQEQAKAGLLVGPKRSAFLEWAKKANARLDLAQEAAPRLRQRLNAEGVRLEIVAADVRALIKEKGLTGASVRAFRATAKSLGGLARSPASFLLLTIGSKEVLVNLGHTINDDTLSASEKWVSALASAGSTGTTALGFAAFFRALKVVLPRVHGGFNSAARGVFLADAVSGQLVEDVDSIASALAGYEEPLPAMRLWQQLGIPEAQYLRIDANKHKKAAWPLEDRSNDVGALEGQHGTERTEYWYSNDGSLHQRLRQILGWPINDKRSPVRQLTREFLEVTTNDQGQKVVQPRSDVMAKMTTYTEPVWTAVRHLERASYEGFDYDSWLADVRGSACNTMDSVVDGDGKTHLIVDENAVRALLASQDLFVDLADKQVASLNERLDAEVQAFMSWKSWLDASSVSDAQKQAALVQLLVNMTATHRANVFMYSAHSSDKADELNTFDHIADYYVYARQPR